MNVNINHQQAGRKDKELSYRRHEHGIDEHSQRQHIISRLPPSTDGIKIYGRPIRENIEQCKQRLLYGV